MGVIHFNFSGHVFVSCCLQLSFHHKTYFTSDNDLVDVLLFAVERRCRDDFELVVPELHQLELVGGPVTELAAHAGVDGAVAVRDGDMGDKATTFNVL